VPRSAPVPTPAVIIRVSLLFWAGK
jgi:hypothetical protein